MVNNLLLRSFHGDGDYDRLAEIFLASASADNLTMTVTAMELAENLNSTPLFDLSRDLIIAEVDEQVVGFGRVRRWEESNRRNYGLTGYVLPEWRRKGIGVKMLAWLETRALEITGEHPATLESYFHVNATQYQTGLHALVKQAGYRVKESWVLMVRPDLDDIPDTPLPAGLDIRPATPDHFSAIWHAVEEAYVPEGGPPPTGAIPEDFKNGPNFQPDLWQVAWEISSNQVAGSVLTYINHAENNQLGILRGYTEGISTVPDWRRRGVAKALIARSLMVQRQLGMKESGLVCSGENLNNYRLYESCGFREVKRDTVYSKSLVMIS